MRACRTHNDCISEALINAEKICDSRGIRFTQLRREVLRLVWASHRPVKAYDLLKSLRTRRVNAQPPTVYRALDFLLANGLIHRLNSLNAFVGCGHPAKHHECYFLFCTICGNIRECCSVQLERVILNAAHKNQFKLQHTTLEMQGECDECRRGVR